MSARILPFAPIEERKNTTKLPLLKAASIRAKNANVVPDYEFQETETTTSQKQLAEQLLTRAVSVLSELGENERILGWMIQDCSKVLLSRKS